MARGFLSKRKKPMKPLISLGFYGVYSVDALEIFCLASSVLTVFTGLFLLRIYCRRGKGRRDGGHDLFCYAERAQRLYVDRPCEQSGGYAPQAGDNDDDGDRSSAPGDPEADRLCAGYHCPSGAAQGQIEESAADH